MKHAFSIFSTQQTYFTKSESYLNVCFRNVHMMNDEFETKICTHQNVNKLNNATTLFGPAV